MLSILDLPLPGTMAVFFTLGWAMAWVIYRLPVICGFLYWLISTYGILSVGVAVYLIWPESRPYIWRLAFIFLAALPGLMVVNFEQLKRLIRIFDKCNVTRQTTGEIIYFRDYGNQDSGTDIHSTPHFSGCSSHYLDAARKRTGRYRREYRH